MPAPTEPANPSDLNAISNDLATLKRDFATLLADLRDGPLSRARTAAQQRAQELGGKAADLYDQASSRAGQGADVVAQQVGDRPLSTLLLAFSVGFIASRLLAR